jgi:cytochrome oxidase assembly protein ShyY1
MLSPRWLGLSASLVAVVAVCVLLGWWQWDRATTEVVREPPSGVAPIDEIHQVGDPVDPAVAGRRVAVRGSFDGARQLLVVDRLDAGESGAWVLTAFVLADPQGVTLPVVRGWLPEGEPPPAPPEGELRLEGWLEPSEPTTLREPGRDPLPQGQVEIVSSPELLSLWTPDPLLQGFVILDEPAPDAPLRPVAPPALSTDSEVDWQNLAYAIQWWLFGLFAVFWFVRMMRVESEDRRVDPDAPSLESLGTIEGRDERGGT